MRAYLQAFVLADQVLVDDVKKKFTVVGIGNKITVTALPWSMGSFGGYVAVTDLEGSVTGEFQILDPEMNLIERLVCNTVRVERKDVQEFRAIFERVVLEKAGRHTVQFLINGEVLGVTRLDVILPVYDFGG